MTRLRFPLKDALHDRNDGDEAALQRIWDEVDARSPRRGRSLRRATAATTVGAALAAVVVVAAAAIVAAVVLRVGRTDAGPLRLADGHALTTLEGSSSRAVAIALADGSRIELGRDARLEPLETSGGTFSAVLARGSADFDVRPGGPRRWTIECGLATVEVVGTRFGCVRGPGRLRVKVDRGTVLVRGERVPDRVRRLGAGEAIEIVDAAGPRSLGSGASAASGPPAGESPTLVPLPLDASAVRAGPTAAPAAGAIVPVGDSRSEGPRKGTIGIPVPATTASRWKELAQRGRHRDAFRVLGAEGVRRESRHLGVDDLLTLADVARLSGHPESAVDPLERVLREFAPDPQAPLAAFALGRIELDALARPARAAAAFERALALGVPAGLREDARARLVEARARDGDRSGASAAAEAYAREFPNGRHTRAIKRWLAAP